MIRCLLLIDIQKGFLKENTSHIPCRIRELLRKKDYDHIVCTRFINPMDGPYVQFLNWHKFKYGADETELDPFIEEISEKVFVKTVYSSLTPEFLEFIGYAGVDEIHVAGLDTDCCILATSLGLFERNMPFKVLLDCCASNGGKESHQAAVKVLKRLIGDAALIDGLD